MVEKTVAEQVMTAFEEFKSTNDARLAQIEKKGAEDPVTVEKLAKIEADLAKFEGLNQKLTAAELELKKEKDHVDELELKLNRMSISGGIDKKSREDEIKENANAWAKAVVAAGIRGEINLTADERKSIQAAVDGYKSLGIAQDSSGGYLAPAEYVREIIKGVTEMSAVRSLVRVRTTASKSIILPKRAGQFAAQWTGDQDNRSETQGLAWGTYEIPTHELYAMIDISQQNMEDSAFNLESELNFEATEQFAVAEGNAVVVGNGIGKPQGFLDAGSGIGETVSGAATAVTGDGMLTMKHNLKTAYTKNAVWAMNRTTLGSVRKLKNTTGDYIWLPGIAGGKPNTIDGDAYVELPDMPSEAANANPVVYGDFKRAYTMVDRVSMTLLRDQYTQATSGNVRFLFRRRLGGQVVLGEALQKLKCST